MLKGDLTICQQSNGEKIIFSSSSMFTVFPPSFRLNWWSSVQVKILLKFLLSSCRLWLKDEGWLFNQCQWLTWNFKSILTWTQHRGFFYWLRGTWVKKTLSKKPNFWQTDDVSRNPSWLQLVESDAPDEILTTCGKWCTWWNFNTSVEIVFLHC